MSFERVTYNADLFVRKQEDDVTWRNKSHENETPLAICCMEIAGDTTPCAIRNADELLSQPSGEVRCVHHYCWTLGMTGRSGWNWLDRLDEEDGLLVQFIVAGGRSRFMPRELFATLEYLPPTRNLIEPLGIRELGRRVLRGSGPVLEFAVSKLAGSVASTIADVIPPNSKDNMSRWYLYRFDCPIGSPDGAHAYGVEWHISRKLILEVGTRLSGRLGIVFLDAPVQGKEAADDRVVTLRGRFGLKHEAEDHWYDFAMLPFEDSGDLCLRITPESHQS